MSLQRISFFVPGIPFAKERPRARNMGKHARVYTPQTTLDKEESFLWVATQHRPPAPVFGAVRLQLDFRMPIPQSKSEKKKAAMAAGDIPHTTRPDIDNLVKLCFDSINGIFFHDDKQVNALIASKQYSWAPGTDVGMEWDDGES